MVIGVAAIGPTPYPLDLQICDWLRKQELHRLPYRPEQASGEIGPILRRQRNRPAGSDLIFEPRLRGHTRRESTGADLVRYIIVGCREALPGGLVLIEIGSRRDVINLPQIARNRSDVAHFDSHGAAKLALHSKIDVVGMASSDDGIWLVCKSLSVRCANH